jgi:hypothetical protein
MRFNTVRLVSHSTSGDDHSSSRRELGLSLVRPDDSTGLSFRSTDE